MSWTDETPPEDTGFTLADLRKLRDRGELTAEDRQCLARKFKNVMLASPAQCVRRPGILAEIAYNRWQAGKTDMAASLAPIYLHVAGGLPA
jgi:tRNA threonylcarbamoyladenosine biosynthesis protein TsaB